MTGVTYAAADIALIDTTGPRGGILRDIPEGGTQRQHVVGVHDMRPVRHERNPGSHGLVAEHEQRVASDVFEAVAHELRKKQILIEVASPFGRRAVRYQSTEPG